MKTTQLQSKPFSRKAKTPVQVAKAVKQAEIDFAIEITQIKAKQAAPVTVAAPVAKSAYVSPFTTVTRSETNGFASDCQ